MTVGIYKITNVENNKVYIGQSVHIERRWSEHQQPKANSTIALAIKKAPNNFIFEIIEKCSVEELDDKEQYWINFYNSIVPNGYNILNVGERPHHTSSIQHFYQAERIQKDILESELTFQEIANKYNTSTRCITRINQGYTFHNNDLTYPLRIKPSQSKYYEKQHSYCVDCGKEVTLHAIRCSECDHKKQRIVERPERNELKQLIRTTPFIQIGKQFNVSDNTIRKWCKSENLPYRSKDIKSYSNEEWIDV